MGTIKFIPKKRTGKIRKLKTKNDVRIQVLNKTGMVKYIPFRKKQGD